MRFGEQTLRSESALGLGSVEQRSAEDVAEPCLVSVGGPPAGGEGREELGFGEGQESHGGVVSGQSRQQVARALHGWVVGRALVLGDVVASLA